MVTSLELYEVLRSHIHEEAARMIAEALQPYERVATRDDMHELTVQLERLRSEFQTGLKTLEASIMRWMLTFFATLWLGLAGMIVAIVLTG